MSITVGNHTLTATITDREGKSRLVAVVATGNLPSLSFLITPRFNSETRKPMPLANSDIWVNTANYPAGVAFTIQRGGWEKESYCYYKASVTVTDMWGQTKTLSRTEYWDPINGGGLK